MLRVPLDSLLLLLLLAFSISGLSLDHLNLTCVSLEGQLHLSQEEWVSSTAVEVRFGSMGLDGRKGSLQTSTFSTKGENRDVFGQGAYAFKLVLPRRLDAGDYQVTSELVRDLSSHSPRLSLGTTPSANLHLSSNCSSTVSPSPAPKPASKSQSRLEAFPGADELRVSRRLMKRGGASGGEVASIVTAIACTAVSLSCLALVWCYLHRQQHQHQHRPRHHQRQSVAGELGSLPDTEANRSDTDETLTPRPRSLPELFKNFPMAERTPGNRSASSITSSDEIHVIPVERTLPLPLAHKKSADLLLTPRSIFRNGRMSRSSTSVPIKLSLTPSSASINGSVAQSESIASIARPRPARAKETPESFKIPRVTVPTYLDDGWSAVKRQRRMSTPSEPLDKMLVIS